MTAVKQRLGRWGENLAAEYLTGKGYVILSRNYRTPYGEIDLVARKEEMTVFVEVKTRSGKGFGLPEEAVTLEKQQHLLEAIQAYWLTQEQEGAWQVDVIAVLRLPGRQPVEIEHFENAIH
jgi:putative endonuclease